MKRAEHPALLLALAAGWLLFRPGPALAVDLCAAPAPGPEAVSGAFDLASQLIVAAEREGVEVALVGRVGQDLSAFGVRYSHLGFLLRDGPDSSWRVVHEYNPCGPEAGKPGLFATGPASFFMDSPHRLEAALVIPSRPLQSALRAVLESATQWQLMGQRYNFLAHPLSATDQNCTQWAAELLAAAMELRRGGRLIATRAEAQDFLGRAGMVSSRIESSFDLRWKVRLFGGADASLDDQPDVHRLTITTADDVIRFLATQDQARLLNLLADPGKETIAAPKQQSP